MSRELPKGLKETMQKQGYHFVGRHSAIKTCEYTANGLRGKTLCYKYTFYGIRSWQCMQSTTAIGCDLACRFCWRLIPEEEGYKWNELNATDSWDDPAYIVEGLIEEHRKLISGFKAFADTELKRRRLEESYNPKHVALSLTGEPLFYPRMSDLLREFHKRGISTFLVHNGSLPEALERLTEMPTQLYISLQAPDKETYEKVVRPKIANSWDRFIRALEVFSKLKTRRVLRMTLVKGLNMHNPEGYAKLIRIADPDYVEVKGFSFVGGARNPKRELTYESMPTHEEIRDFAEQIARYSSYIYTAEHRPSRVVLLSRDKEAADNRIIDFSKIGKDL
ncbi:MAG: 4-demethylwyosine synthase TYW1 [Candidatus Micrarchaeota archaeon]|nr:MAG: 4-demethylwyosine synthase TYW1 [Candidatus Micrarchaeota archaeon]